VPRIRETDPLSEDHAVEQVFGARAVAQVRRPVVGFDAVAVRHIQTFRSRSMEGQRDEAMNGLADHPTADADVNGLVSQRMWLGFQDAPKRAANSSEV